MHPILELRNIKKRYPGVTALDDVSFSVKRGKVLGLLGPNGSGKSTFMRIAVGQSQPDAGAVLIDGKPPGYSTRSIISYVPEHDHIYTWMTVEEAKNFFSSLFPRFKMQNADEMMEFMKIPQGVRVGSLSKGMRARLKLVLALAWEAELVLLDEPLSGIDPASRDKVLQGVLMDCSKRGVSMVISTHLVSEVEPLLNEVVFLDKGRVKLQGDCDDIRETFGFSLDQVMRRELL